MSRDTPSAASGGRSRSGCGKTRTPPASSKIALISELTPALYAARGGSGVGEDQLDHGGRQEQHRSGGEHRPDGGEPDQPGGPRGNLAVLLADLLELAWNLGDEGHGGGGNHGDRAGSQDRDPAGLAGLERGARGRGHVLEQIPVFGQARPGLRPGSDDQ